MYLLPTTRVYTRVYLLPTSIPPWVHPCTPLVYTRPAVHTVSGSVRGREALGSRREKGLGESPGGLLSPKECYVRYALCAQNAHALRVINVEDWIDEGTSKTCGAWEATLRRVVHPFVDPLITRSLTH